MKNGVINAVRDLYFSKHETQKLYEAVNSKLAVLYTWRVILQSQNVDPNCICNIIKL